MVADWNEGGGLSGLNLQLGWVQERGLELVEEDTWVCPFSCLLFYVGRR